MAYENNIAKAQKYLPILDKIYKTGSITSVLDTSATRLNFSGADTVKIFKMSVNGLGDYSRSAGFPTGSVTGSWEQFKLTQDRGRSFMIDAMDNEESMNMAFGNLAAEFMRTEVIPEIDAYRMAKYASVDGIGAATPANITVGTTDVAGMIRTALSYQFDREVPDGGKILFISDLAYRGLQANISRVTENRDGIIATEITNFEGLRVVKVPTKRFNTAITLLDGVSADEEAGGYTVPASTSYPINFLIVSPDSVAQTVKHAVPRIFSPQVNQRADAWQYDYRIYHDAYVWDNKKDGIYLSRAATANS